jgi:glycine cleavage system H protein
MSPELVFRMGQYEACFPADRLYAKNHMWAQSRSEVFRFGFTSYAVRLLQDVYFLDWTVEPGAQVERLQEIGAIESKKAESDLYAPLAGRLTALNPALLSDPSAINFDPYGQGWLLEIAGDGTDLLTPAAYVEHLAAVWEITQRTIKGKLNASP